ncbi:MAG: phytoene desaturase family protein [Ktedonobacteraceae bacterium]
MSATKRITIIGAGIGGLSAAIRLAAQGHQVRILERQPQVGGKLNQVVMNGFTFDTGPSLITMPYVLRNLFQTAGRRVEDYLELLPLEVTCRYFYRDGQVLNAWRDHERLAAEFARFNTHDGAELAEFIRYARTIFQAAADPFLYNSLGGPLDVLGTFIRYVRQGHAALAATDQGTQYERLRAVLAALSPATLDSCVRGFFEDEHLRQLFDRYATYNGSSPYQVGAVYSIIPYVELADGGWYPCGGIYTLAQALEKIARELGVQLELNCDVKRILVERGEARGVVLADGRVLRSDCVIANSDVVTTQRDLLSPAISNKRQVQRLERLEPSCSGFVILLGTDKQYPQLEHHNIFFSDDYPGEFEDLFERKIPLRNPTVYVCATTRTDPSQAPAGHENLFILVNAPYLTAQSNWQRDAPAYREHVLDLLASYTQIDLADLRAHSVCQAVITPEDFKQRYGANAGSIYGLSSNARMAPFLRPGNRSPSVRGLYFVGGSTHPGGGVPLVMLSGKIVADLVAEDML